MIAAITFLVLAGAVAIAGGRGFLSSNGIPGPLFPAMSLPRLAAGEAPFTTADLGPGAVVVNVFSSWCGPCRAEHPFLMELEKTAPIIGINYMDDHGKARMFLDRLGNPYRDIAVDESGQLEGILGIDSVPRTLVVVDGRIVYAHRGRLKREDVDGHIVPLLKQYRAQSVFDPLRSPREETPT